MRKGLFLVIIIALSINLYSQKEIISQEQRFKFEDNFFKAMKERAEENFISEIMFLEECNKIDQHQYVVFLELGKAYFKIKEYEKSEINLLKSYNLDSKNIEILESICKYYLLMENKKELINWLEKLTEIDEKYQKDLLERYVEVEEYEKALILIQKIKKNKNNLIGALTVEKNIYYSKGDYEKSVEICDELIILEPKNETHYISKSYIYTSTNQIPKGLAILVDFAEKNPNKPLINLTLANFYLKVNDISESIKYAKSTLGIKNLSDESKMEYLYNLFQTENFSEDVNKKIEQDIIPYMEENQLKSPKYALLLYSFYKKIEDYPKAIEKIKIFIEKEKNLPEDICIEYLMIISQEKDYKFLYKESSKVIELYPMSAVSYLIKGFAANMLEERKEALDIFESGLALVYDNKKLESEFYSNIADVYYRDKNYKKSDIYFEKAIVLNSANYLVMNNYSYYLSLRRENLEKARDFMEIVTSENPNNITYLDTYLWVLYQIKDYKKSLEIAMQVKELLEKDTFKEDGFEVREHLGDVFLENGLKEEAIKQWEKGIELGAHKRDLNKKIKNAKK